MILHIAQGLWTTRDKTIDAHAAWLQALAGLLGLVFVVLTGLRGCTTLLKKVVRNRWVDFRFHLRKYAAVENWGAADFVLILLTVFWGCTGAIVALKGEPYRENGMIAKLSKYCTEASFSLEKMRRIIKLSEINKFSILYNTCISDGNLARGWYQWEL